MQLECKKLPDAARFGLANPNHSVGFANPMGAENQLPDIEESFDVTQDPVFQMEGYDSETPADVSANLDAYLYGDRYPHPGIHQ